MDFRSMPKKVANFFGRFTLKRVVILSLIALLIVTVIMALIGLFRYGSFFAFIWIYPILTDWLIMKTGMDIWLARAVSVVVITMLVISVPYIYETYKGEKRIMYAIFGGIIALIFVGGFYITKDIAFNPEDGSAAKCYYQDPSGKIIFAPCEWKYDPVYKSPVYKVNESIVRAKKIQEQGPIKMRDLNMGGKVSFFDAATGEPLIWYYQWPDGKIDFFDHPGYHPQNSAVLSPVTPEVVMQFKKYIEGGNQSKVSIGEDEGRASKQNGPAMHNLENLRDLLKDLNNRRNE